MANSLKFSLRYTFVVERSPDGQRQSIVKLFRRPVMEFYGEGLDIVDAENDAARKAVEYLQMEARHINYFYC